MIRGMIRSKWGKFTEQEVESLKNDLSQLSERIQKAYGIAKEHADHQYDLFAKSVQALTGQTAIEHAQVVPIKIAR